MFQRLHIPLCSDCSQFKKSFNYLSIFDSPFQLLRLTTYAGLQRCHLFAAQQKWAGITFVSQNRGSCPFLQKYSDLLEDWKTWPQLIFSSKQRGWSVIKPLPPNKYNTFSICLKIKEMPPTVLLKCLQNWQLKRCLLIIDHTPFCSKVRYVIPAHPWGKNVCCFYLYLAPPAGLLQLVVAVEPLQELLDKFRQLQLAGLGQAWQGQTAKVQCRSRKLTATTLFLSKRSSLPSIGSVFHRKHPQ